MSQLAQIGAGGGFVEWVAFVSGAGTNEDYAPSSSSAITIQLKSEIVRLCQEFHSLTESPPADFHVYFFWRATTGHWVITRSRQPKRTAGRAVIEYLSLVITDTDFARIDRDPWLVVDNGLFEIIEDGRAIAGATLRLPRFRDSNTLQLVEHATIRADGETKPGVRAWDPSAETVLRSLCRAAVDIGADPPTFATWWPSAVPVQSERFQITYRAIRARARSTAEASEQLLIELKTLVFGEMSTSTDIHPLFDNTVTLAERCFNSINAAQMRIDIDDISEWHARAASAAADALSASSSIASALRIVQTATPGQRDALTTIGNAYKDLANTILAQPPPVQGRGLRDLNIAPLSAGRSAGERRTEVKPRGADDGGQSHRAAWMTGISVVIVLIIASVLVGYSVPDWYRSQGDRTTSAIKLDTGQVGALNAEIGKLKGDKAGSLRRAKILKSIAQLEVRLDYDKYVQRKHLAEVVKDKANPIIFAQLQGEIASTSHDIAVTTAAIGHLAGGSIHATQAATNLANLRTKMKSDDQHISNDSGQEKALNTEIARLRKQRSADYARAQNLSGSTGGGNRSGANSAR